MRPTTITLRGFFTGLCAGVILFGALAFGVTAQVSKPVSTPDIQRVIPQSGSRGQYLTIQGSALGVIQGTVSFVRAGQEVPADIQMPAVCQRIWWRDSSIVFKVPQSAKTGANTIKIKNSEGTLLKEVAFTVTDGVAPPGICGIVPDNGPAGVPVHVYGERFGSTPGRVSFGATTLTIPESQWHSDDITTTVPQFGGTTTAVRVITADQTLTNPGSYALGQCRPNQCGEGSSCCADGSCRPTGLCAEKQTAMCSYSWSFFTGKLKRQGESCVKSNECLSGACGKDGKCAAGVKVAGEMCVFDGECAGGAVCLNGRCATSLRKIGDACKGSNECSSQMCKDGICAAGSKNIGEQCVQKEECATQNCVNGQCAQSIRCLKVEKIEPQGKNIRENSVFSVTFNQLVSHESVTSNFGLNPKVAGTYEFETIGSGNDAKTKALFKPSNYLSRQKLYAVSIGKNIQSASSANTIGACVNDSGAVCVGAGQICTAPGATCTSGAKCTGPNSVCSGTGSTCTGTNAKCVDGADCAQKNRSIQQGCFLTKVSDASFASSVAIDEPWHWSISALAAVIKNSSHHVWHQAQLAFSSFFHSSIPDVLAADAPLPNPTNLEAKPAENNTIILTWAYPANVSIAGFEIYRKKEGQADYAIIKADVASSLRTYTDTSLEVGKRYDYQVYAFRYAGPTPTPRCGDGTIDIGEQCDDGDTINDNACANDCKLKGEDATVTHEKPSAPGNLSATGVTSSTIELSWTDTSTNELNFVIERSLDGSNYTLLTSPGYDTTTFVDTGLSANTNYWYRVYAANDIGQSAASNVVNQKTSLFSICLKGKPLAPTSVSTEKVTNSNDISVKLSWVDTSNNEDGFLIQRAVDGGQAAELYRTANDITEYHDSSVEAGHSYSYTIASFDCAGASAAPASSITISGSSPQDESCAAGYTLCGTPPNQICYIGTTCPSQPGPSQCDNDTTCEAGEGCTCNDCNGKQDSCTASLVCRADGGDVCALASCGDGKKDTGESCDDGNSNNADSCRNDCSLQTCGNRVIDAGEQCDDGRNGNDEDGCTNLCLTVGQLNCAAGYTLCGTPPNQICYLGTTCPSQPGPSQCDNDTTCEAGEGCTCNDCNGKQDSCTASLVCRADGGDVCALASCGDGKKDTGESCDDGNSNNADSCRNDCSLQTCGNRVIDAGEQCDDGRNGNDEDGCTNLCQHSSTGGGGGGLDNKDQQQEQIIKPSKPTGVRLDVVSDTQINVFWNDTTTEQRYFIERSSDGTAFSRVATAGMNTTQYADTGLSRFTRYWYRIIAANSAGDSNPSDSVDARTNLFSFCFTGVPTAPTNFSAESIAGTANIVLRWTDTAQNERAVDIQRSSNNQDFATIYRLPANTGTYLDSNINPQTQYWYRVGMTNCKGESVFSNISSATSGTSGGSLPPGAQCTANNQCSSNICQNGVCTSGGGGSGDTGGTTPPGGSCTTNNQCASSICQNGICKGKNVGDACTIANECSSGLCTNGVCTSGGGGSGDTGGTTPPGGSCTTNNQCTTNLCFNGKCDDDKDKDGLPDSVDPNSNNPDTDGDGLLDGQEDKNKNGRVDQGETDPTNPDTDHDGLLDGQEDKNKNGIKDPNETDPLNPDTDGDGVLDGADPYPLDPTKPGTGAKDSDGDGLSDDLEKKTGTNPNKADTDGDGLLDGQEDKNKNGKVDKGETNPKKADSDGNGIKDGDQCSVIKTAYSRSPLADLDGATYYRESSIVFHMAAIQQPSGRIRSGAADANATISGGGDGTTLNAPTNVLASDASSISSAKISLSWNDSNTEATFTIQRSTDQTTWSLLVAGHTAKTYDDTSSLERGRTYWYRVRAVKGDVTSDWATTPEGVMPPTQPGERYTIAGINIRKAGAGNITFDLFECVGDTCQYDVQQTTQFPGNQHGYTLTAYALNSSGAEVLVTDPVVWESAVLSTQSSGADAQAEINRITGSPHLFTITARKNGSAVATITATAGGVSVSKQLAIEVRVCDNPWRIGTQTGYDNLDYDFSLSYCRGNGSTNLLPTLGGAIPVGTRSEYPHFERELFFPVSGSSDVIVVAFARSPKYFSPSLWYQYTIGGGFSVRDPINGYPTIQDSTGTYVMAFDTTDDGGKGATVYYFTTNTGASQTTQHILGELLSGVQFSSHGFSYDAVNTDGRGMKLRRDFTRLLHFEYLTSLLDRYAAQKRSYPKLESGTYRKNETISGWPSWKNELARSLGVASASFPDDPYPKAGNFCETDATCVAQCSVANYDKATCWNATAKLFGITTAGGKTAVETAVNTERVHAYSYHYTTATNSYKACARFEVLKASTTGNLYVGCVTGAVSAAGVVSSSGASTAGGGSTTGGFGTLFGQLFFTLPPEILITVPTSGQAFQRNWEPEQRVTFHGSASDPEGLPLTVGNTLDGTDPQTTNIDINKLSSGNHTYTFFARNSARASSTLSRTFTVTQQADNHQPSASVSAPTTIVRQSANTGELMFTVNASDPDSGDGISRVDYSFGSLSGTLTAAPYTKTLSLSSFSDNTYTLTITVYDQRYGVRYSDTVGRKQITQQIRLRTNTAPTFYNTMPDNNLTYYTDTGSTVTIRGLADDTIDGIATVKLYRVGQSSPLRTVTDHNYSFLLENLPVGQYQYRVVAADTLGMEAEYTLSFTVASPPLPNAACELIEFPSTVRKESSNSQLVIRFKNTGSRPWILDPDDRPRYVVQDMQPAPNGYTYWWGQSQLFPSELNNNPDGRIIPPGGVINAVLYGVWIGAPAGTHTMKWQMHYRNSPFGEQCTKQVVVKQDKPDIVIGAPSANEYVSKFSNAVQVLATVSHDVPDVEWIAGYVDKGLSSQINLGATTSIAASSNNYSRSFDATTLALGQHRLTIESKYKNIGVIGQKSITFEVRYPINTFTFSRKVSGSWQNISGTSVSVAQTPTNTPQILSIGVLPTYNLPLLVPQVSTTFDSTPTATQDIDINSILAGTHTFTYLADYGNNATPLCTNPKTQCFTLTVAITLPPGADQSPDTTSPNGFKSQTKSIIWSGGTATFSEFTVLGINVPASISVVGGEYSKNGGAWTTSAGIVRNSDKVTVRVSGIGTCGRFPRTATVTIGATSATFVGKSSAPASRCKSSGAPLGFFQEYLHYFMNLLYS